MIMREQPVAGAAERLCLAEILLEQALCDLAAADGQAPGARCAAALTEAAAELQACNTLLLEEGAPADDRTVLRQRIAALVPRLRRLERLLGSAGEFYRGWCAAAPPASSGYEIGEPLSDTRPALLAWEA